jgi:carboxylate-amine ligase
MLLPTAAHPLMDPFNETRLWPHDNNEVYELYNKIFDCSGHGWSNLQSTHLNLPFSGDEEFSKLHTAIRLILPILPALCASSPLLDKKLSGALDTRLLYYKSNQAKIPSITGSVIPEAVFSYHDYNKTIYAPIKKDISPFNQDNFLDPVWVNSRGAIARFDRGSIEIRIMDIQECPAADLAIVNLVVELLRALVDEMFCDFNEQARMDTSMLSNLFDKMIISGGETEIDNPDYLAAFGLRSPLKAKELWKHILSTIPADTPYKTKWQKTIQTILHKGSLAERIIRAINQDHSKEHIRAIYKELSACLAGNKIFEA